MRAVPQSAIAPQLPAVLNLRLSDTRWTVSTSNATLHKITAGEPYDTIDAEFASAAGVIVWFMPFSKLGIPMPGWPHLSTIKFNVEIPDLSGGWSAGTTRLCAGVASDAAISPTFWYTCGLRSSAGVTVDAYIDQVGGVFATTGNVNTRVANNFQFLEGPFTEWALYTPVFNSAGTYVTARGNSLTAHNLSLYTEPGITVRMAAGGAIARSDFRARVGYHYARLDVRSL